MNTQTKVREAVHAVEAPNPQLPAVAESRPRGNGEPVVLPEGFALIPTAVEYPKSIARALVAIMRDVGTIKKSGYNNFHKYHYQEWEDVLERLSPLLAEHGLIIMQSEVGGSISDRDALISISYEFTIINAEGEVWPKAPRWRAISRLCDGKGVYDDKAANKCHTQAHKYFLIHQFNIKTRDTVIDDSDRDGQSVRAQSASEAPNPNNDVPSAPRTLRIGGQSPQSWSARYLQAVQGAKTPAEVKAWEKANAASLGRLEEVHAEVFTDLINKVAQHVAQLIEVAKPKPEPAKAKSRAPNPNAPDPDVERIEAGRDDGSTVTWEDDPTADGIPDNLRRVAPKKKELLDQIAKLSEADLDRFMEDPDFYKRKGELSEADRRDVEIACFQRAKAVKTS